MEEAEHVFGFTIAQGMAKWSSVIDEASRAVLFPGRDHVGPIPHVIEDGGGTGATMRWIKLATECV
jgi:hypothetical protein